MSLPKAIKPPAKPAAAAAAATVVEPAAAAAAAAAPATTLSKPDVAKSAAARISAVYAGQADPGPQHPATADKGTGKAAAAAATTHTPDPELDAEIAKQTQGMDEKKRSEFTQLRYDHRDALRKIKESEGHATALEALKKENEALKAGGAKAAEPEDLKKLREELEAAHSELRMSKVEATPDFKKQVLDPRANLEAAVAEIVKKYDGADGAAVLAAVKSNDDAKLAEVMATMSERDKLKLFNAADDFATLTTTESALRASAKELLEKHNASAQTTQDTKAQELKELRDKTHEATWKELQTQFPALAAVEGEDDESKSWNAALTDAQTFAKDGDFHSLAVADQASVMAQAGLYPLLSGMVLAMQAEIDEKDKLLGTYKKTTPRSETGGSGRGEGKTSNDPVPGETDFAKRVTARLKTAGAIKGG